MGGQEALGAGEYAGQVIQPGGGQELPCRAPDGAGLVVIQEQVPGHDVLRLAPGGGGNLPVEAALLLPVGVQGHQVLGGVILGAVVAVPVQVNGHPGDQGHVLLHIHQAHIQTVFPADQHPAGHAQGAVQPAVVDHAAVALGGQADKLAGKLRVIPQAEAGRVGVAGGQHKARGAVLGYTKGHQRGSVLGDKILPAGGQGPLPCRQLGVTLGQQTLPEILHRVEAVGAFLNVLQHG